MSDSLRLHRSLYRGSAIRSSAAAFAHLAQIEVEEGEAEILIRFDAIDPDVAHLLVDAFANHALAATVRAHRAGQAEDPSVSQRRNATDLRDDRPGVG